MFAGTPTIFTGYLTGHELAQAYASADVFVFPSAHETFGNVVLEAMASGLPIAAVRSGGPVDFVQDGSTGFLCSPTYQSELTERVRYLVENREVRLSMGDRARLYAETRDWNTVFDHLMMDYEVFLGERRQISLIA